MRPFLAALLAAIVWLAGLSVLGPDDLSQATFLTARAVLTSQPAEKGEGDGPRILLHAISHPFPPDLFPARIPLPVLRILPFSRVKTHKLIRVYLI